MITGHAYHDDVTGIVGTALVGAAQWQNVNYRDTGIVMPALRVNDFFTCNFQMPHRKRLGAAVDSVHVHAIPHSTVAGPVNVKFSYIWGWFNIGSEIPVIGDAAWTQSSTADIPIAAGSGFKQQVIPIITNLTPPASESYSSLLLCKITRVAASADDYGANDLIIAYADAHVPVDRLGSYNEHGDR